MFTEYIHAPARANPSFYKALAVFRYSFSDAVFLYHALPRLPLRNALWSSVYSKVQIPRIGEAERRVKAYMNVLTAEMGTLRKEFAELKKDMKASKEKTRRLQEETNTLRIQRQGLNDSIEILTKERDIFQKTIQELCQAVRKQKRTR